MVFQLVICAGGASLSILGTARPRLLWYPWIGDTMPVFVNKTGGKLDEVKGEIYCKAPLVSKIHLCLLL